MCISFLLFLSELEIFGDISSTTDTEEDVIGPAPKTAENVEKDWCRPLRRRRPLRRLLLRHRRLLLRRRRLLRHRLLLLRHLQKYILQLTRRASSKLLIGDLLTMLENAEGNYLELLICF